MEDKRLNDVKISLRSLVQTDTRKVTINSLSKDYIDLCGLPIPYKLFGYTNLEEFLKSLTDVLIIHGSGETAEVTAIVSEKSFHIREMIKNQKKSSGSNSRRSSNNNKSFKEEEMNRKPEKTIIGEKATMNKTHIKDHFDVKTSKTVESSSCDSINLNFPNDFVICGSNIAEQSSLQINACLKIIISEVHSPSRFWFQLLQEKQKLDQLIAEMKSYYIKLEERDLSMSRRHIIPGQDCSVFYDDLWYRAIILTEPKHDYVKVLFVDYGTVSDVHINNIKYLKISFTKLPAQAMLGSLSHIHPIQNRWSKEAIVHFLDLTVGIVLHAKITEIIKKERIHFMVICTANDTIEQVNTNLIDNNYALYTDDWINDFKNVLDELTT